MTIRSRRRILAAGAITATTALVLAACGSGNDGADAADGGRAKDQAHVEVVATTTQICDYVTQIATDDSPEAKLSFTKTDSSGAETHAGADEGSAEASLDLTCLLAPNASAHNHEMTPQQMKALGDADLFLVSGVDLEHFLDSAVESSGFHGVMGVTSGVLTADEVEDLPAQEAKERDLPYEVFRGDRKVEVATWPFPPEEGEKEPEFRYDPHVWTSPADAAIQVHNIGEALKKVTPDHADLFTKRVGAYETQLTDLDSWVKQSIETVPEEHRVLFTSHDAFGYFSKHYGVTFIGAAMSDFNAQQDATAEHIRAAAEQVKESGAVALFAENSNNSASVEAVARAAGVKAIIGDDALYGDSLGPDGSAGVTYVGSIVHNVRTLVDAWNGKPADLPASLPAGADVH